MRVNYANDNGLSVSVSKTDLYEWQHKPGKVWPCATIRKPFWAVFNYEGDLEDTNLPEGADARELAALIDDLTSDACNQPWRKKDQREWLDHYSCEQNSRL
jgi:hypothetical protein